MAQRALRFLLENLSQLLESDNVNNFVGDDDDYARKELELLKADVGSLLDQGPVDIKLEVVYDVEDTIDALLSSTGHLHDPHGVVNIQLAQTVKFLRECKLKPIMMMLEKGKMINSANKTTALLKQRITKLEKVSLIPTQESFIGFKDEEEKLVDYLTQETEELDVITIVGMVGLGKTTLASTIFQNEKIHYEFPTRIWVNVSQEFNMRNLLLYIPKQLTIRDDIYSLIYQELLESVQAHLKECKFLLVLDDVWTTKDWNGIRNVLLKQNRMCKVIITSRSMEVGDHTKKVHRIRFLRHEESWELLQLTLFGKACECPPQLKNIGESIARHCEGLPFEIMVMGGILMAQLVAAERNVDVTQKAWTNVASNVSGFSTRYSKLEDMLALSYNALPNDELRDCFLYLGVFPEDYEIPIWTLTRLWIAEGFIQPKQGQRLEEAAEVNL